MGRRWLKGGAISLVFVAAFGVSACSSGGESSLQADNRALREDNEQLREDNDQLREEVEQLEDDLAKAEEAASTSPDSGESDSTVEPEVQTPETEGTEEEASGSGGSGKPLAQAGPGDVSGEDPLPEIVPPDYPIPAGAVIEYANGDYYSFTIQFVVDAEFEQVASFYDERLASQGWEETDRTDYEQEGLAGVDTSWENDVYIPQDSEYEQRRYSTNITVQEIEPSGVGVYVSWQDYKLLDRNYEEEQQNQSDGDPA